MDVTKLLQSLEEFVYEIACLAVLLPKTLFRLTLFPRRVFQYVTLELQKPAEERFQEQASPLIQWLVVGLLPHFFTLCIFASLPVLRALLPSNELFDFLLRLSAEGRFTVLSVFAISLPVALAVVTVWERGETVSKATLRSPLYMHCYSLSPQLLAAFPLWYLWEASRRGVHEDITQYGRHYGTCLAVWFVYTTLVLFRLQLKVSWKRAFVLLGEAYLVFLGIVVVLETGILVILGVMLKSGG